MIISILKIIGIVLLVILVLLIIILGILLMVPIRYRFEGEYVEKPRADILVRWTPLLLKVTVNYHNNQLAYIIKLFGGVIMTNQDIPLSWLGKKLFPLDGHNTTDKSVSNAKDLVAVKQDKNRDFSSKPEAQSDAQSIDSSRIEQKRKKKRKSILKTIGQKVQDVKQKLKQLIDKLKRINEKKDALLKVYHSKRFEMAKKDVISYIKILWQIIKPKKLEGRIHYGMNDPATTGQLSGVLAMFLVWYDENLQLQPDFEQQCIDGYLKGNGKFPLFPIVRLAIKIILNKNLIKVIKKVQTIIEA